MKTKIILAVLILAITVAAVRSQQPTSNVKPAPDRFRLISGEAMVQTAVGTEYAAPAKGMFLLDTETGQTWRYQPPYKVKSADGKETMLPDQWVPINFPSNR